MKESHKKHSSCKMASQWLWTRQRFVTFILQNWADPGEICDESFCVIAVHCQFYREEHEDDYNSSVIGYIYIYVYRQNIWGSGLRKL